MSPPLPSHPPHQALVRSYFPSQQTNFFAIIIEKRLNPAWSSPQLYTQKHHHQIILMFHQEISLKKKSHWTTRKVLDPSLFIYFLNFYLFYFKLPWSALLCVGFLQCGVQAFHCGDLSRCIARASVLAAHGLSGCSWAQLPSSVWGLTRPGTELVSPAFQGGLPTTGPPGNPRKYTFCGMLFPEKAGSAMPLFGCHGSESSDPHFEVC